MLKEKHRSAALKDPYAVLQQKEEDVARLRKEIASLLTIIPLISDEPVPYARPAHIHGDQSSVELVDPEPIELKRYFPFVRHIRG